jgi:hypothetical protein
MQGVLWNHCQINGVVTVVGHGFVDFDMVDFDEGLVGLVPD